MSHIEDQVHAIEQNIMRSKKAIGFADALVRLQSNRDFKTVILDGFLSSEAIRLVHLKADPSMQEPKHQQQILLQIDAIGTLKEYFRTAAYQGEMARKAIIADEEMRDELTQGEDHGA